MVVGETLLIKLTTGILGYVSQNKQSENQDNTDLYKEDKSLYSPEDASMVGNIYIKILLLFIL